ncbi:lactaldehyde dehydrogenase, partial [Klebsiella pneumoniae]
QSGEGGGAGGAGGAGRSAAGWQRLFLSADPAAGCTSGDGHYP